MGAGRLRAPGAGRSLARLLPGASGTSAAPSGLSRSPRPPRGAPRRGAAGPCPGGGEGGGSLRGLRGSRGAPGLGDALGSRDAPGLRDAAGLTAVLGSKDEQG